MDKNVLGGELISCSIDPLTGYFRTGCCETDENDLGTHTVCAQVSQEFLDYSKSKGNDLMTPIPAYNFPGLKEGDFWCLCALRWLEAYRVVLAPRVKLEATNHLTLRIIPFELLESHKIEG